MAIRIWRQLLQANHKSIPRCWSPHPPRGQHQSEKYDVGASWECPQPQYNRTLIVASRRRSPGTCGRSAKYSRRVGTQGPTDRANHHQNRQLGPDIAHRHIRNFDRCGRLVGMDRNFGLSRPIADCPAIVDGPARKSGAYGQIPRISVQDVVYPAFRPFFEPAPSCRVSLGRREQSTAAYSPRQCGTRRGRGNLGVM